MDHVSSITKATTMIFPKSLATQRMATPKADWEIAGSIPGISVTLRDLESTTAMEEVPQNQMKNPSSPENLGFLQLNCAFVSQFSKKY